MNQTEIRKEVERITKAGGVVSPGPTDVHVNRPLTNISIAYSLDASMYVADRVFPDVPVMKQSDLYYTIPRGAFMRDELKERAPGTESAGMSFTFEQDNYRCKTWAGHKNIDDETRANYDAPLTADRTATRFLTEKGMIRKERLFIDTYMKTGVWTYRATGAAAAAGANYLAATDAKAVFWSTSTSTPIEDIRRWRRVVQSTTGRLPNVLVLGPQVYDALLDHPDIVARLDRGQTVGLAMVTRAALAAIFELEEVLVMEGTFNSGVEGADDSIGFVNATDALLCYRTSAPALEEPTAGYTFSWTARIGAGDMGTRIKRMRIETHESDRIEIQMAFVQKVVAPDLGFWIDSIVA